MAGLGHIIEPRFFSYVLNRRTFCSFLNFFTLLIPIPKLCDFSQFLQLPYPYNFSFYTLAQPSPETTLSALFDLRESTNFISFTFWIFFIEPHSLPEIKLSV
jgi:hypothetical protein